MYTHTRTKNNDQLTPRPSQNVMTPSTKKYIQAAKAEHANMVTEQLLSLGNRVSVM